MHTQRGLSVAEDQFCPVFFRNHPFPLLKVFFTICLSGLIGENQFVFINFAQGVGCVVLPSIASDDLSVRLINSLCNYRNAEYVSIIDERILYTAAEPSIQWSNQRGNLIYARCHDGGGNKNLWTFCDSSKKHSEYPTKLIMECSHCIEWKLLIFHFRGRDRRIESSQSALATGNPVSRKQQKLLILKLKKDWNIHFLVF